MFSSEYWSNLFAGNDLLSFFFKSAGIIFSLVMLVYTMAIIRQTQIMTKTVQGKRNPFVIFVSFLAIIAALAMLFYALFLI